MLLQQSSKHFSSPSYVTVFPSHSTLLDLITLKIFGELYKSCNCASGLCNFLQPFLTFSTSGPSVFHSTQISQVFSNFKLHPRRYRHGKARAQVLVTGDRHQVWRAANMHTK
jgi:hypothetical protein